MDLSAVAAWLQHNASMRPVEDANNYVMTSEGIVCTVMPQSELGRELISDVFEIGSSASVVCQIDKFEHYAAGMEHLLHLCVALLTKLSCDMVMLSNGERGLAFRRQGRVYVDCREKYWQAKWREALSGVGIPFVERDLPSL